MNIISFASFALLSSAVYATLPDPKQPLPTGTVTEAQLGELTGAGQGYLIGCRDRAKSPVAKCVTDARAFQQKSNRARARTSEGGSLFIRGYVDVCTERGTPPDQCIAEAQRLLDTKYKGIYSSRTTDVSKVAGLNGVGQGYYARCEQDPKAKLDRCLLAAEQMQSKEPNSPKLAALRGVTRGYAVRCFEEKQLKPAECLDRAKTAREKWQPLLSLTPLAIETQKTAELLPASGEPSGASR